MSWPCPECNTVCRTAGWRCRVDSGRGRRRCGDNDAPLSEKKRRPRRRSVRTVARHQNTGQPSSKSLTHPPVHSPAVAHWHSHTSFMQSLRLSTQLVRKGFCFCVHAQKRGRPGLVALCCCLRGSAARFGGSARRLARVRSICFLYFFSRLLYLTKNFDVVCIFSSRSVFFVFCAMAMSGLGQK